MWTNKKGGTHTGRERERRGWGAVIDSWQHDRYLGERRQWNRFLLRVWWCCPSGSQPDTYSRWSHGSGCYQGSAGSRCPGLPLESVASNYTRQADTYNKPIRTADPLQGIRWAVIVWARTDRHTDRQTDRQIETDKKTDRVKPSGREYDRLNKIRFIWLGGWA